MVQDKPNVTYTHSELFSDTEAPDAFTYTTKAGVEIAFPDLYGMEAEEGEKFLAQLRQITDGAFLKKWLTAEQSEALAADKLSLRHRQTLMQRAVDHYESVRDELEEVDGKVSHADLDAEVTVPTQFVYTTAASKRVAFPDMYAMEADQGEKFLIGIRTKSDSEFLAKWLTPDGVKALEAEKFSFRTRKHLIRKVVKYYEGTMGDPGEGNASES